MQNLFSLGRRWCILGGIAAATLLACQQKSPEEELLKTAEPAGSWVAALEMVGQKWAANSVPTSFVKNSVSAAGKEFDKVAKEAGKSQARPELRDAVRGLASEARAASHGLERAVQANDRGAVAREVGRLTALKSRFKALPQGG